MLHRYRTAAIAAVVLLLSGWGAHATTSNTYGYTCTDNALTDKLETALTGTTAWTSVNGNTSGPNYGTGGSGLGLVTGGDIVQLTGICQGDIQLIVNGVPITGVTITNSTASNTYGSDGINGQVEVKNSQLTLQGLVLESGQNGDNMSGGESANVYIHDAGSAILNGDNVESGPLIGVYVFRSSSAQLLSSYIHNNGSTNTAKANDGIRVEGNSTVSLGVPGVGHGSIVRFNTGNGITLLAGSSMTSYGSTIRDNADCATQCGAQIYVTGASTATISGDGVYSGATSTSQPALIEAFGGSFVTVDQNSSIESTGGGVSGGLFVAGASSAILADSIFAMSGTPLPVLEASANSSIIFAGGNTVCAGTESSGCTPSSSGIAMEADHSSSMLTQRGVALGYANAAESITGKGVVQMQSSMDLGQGPVSSAFGILWTGNIAVQQNSAFRMQGGAHVTGSVQLSQQSNAFFNCNNSLASGGSTSPNCGGVSGGGNQIDGTVQCPELITTNQNPSSHVSNPTLVTVTALTANLYGSGSFAAGSPAANTCLNF